MKFNPTSGAFSGRMALLLCLLMTFITALAQARDLRFEGSLVWATNDEKSPDPNHKPVDADVLKKLGELPLKWKNYFAVTNVAFAVPGNDATSVTMSEKCKVRVKHLNHDNFEVSLIGKGEPVLKRTQPLPKNEMLVVGGNAPGSNGWLVVLKRLD